MLSEKFSVRIEQLAEAVVFADTVDLRTLAQMHELMGEAAKIAQADGSPRVAAALQECTNLVLAIILAEVQDTPAALQVVQKTIETCQNILQDIVEADSAPFPTELGIPGPTDAISSATADAPAAKSAAAPVPQVQSTDEEEPALPAFDPSTGDTALIGEFINEALEHLENAEVALLTLETSPDDTESVNAVFRAFHTIKGVAGMLQIAAIQQVAHESEGLLDKVRKGELQIATPVMDASFRAIDGLRRLVKSVASALRGGLMVPDLDLPALIREIRALSDGEFPKEEKPRVVREHSKPLGEILVDNGVLTHDDVAKALYLQHHDLPPREIGEMLVRGNILTRARMESVLERQKEAPDKKFGEVVVEKGWATEEEILAVLMKQQPTPVPAKLGEVIVRSNLASGAEVADALRKQQQARACPNAVREVVKVDAERLDRLVDMIGELVIAQSMVMQADNFRTSAGEDVLRHLDQLDRITRELQETGMSLRMVPLRSTFQKIARLARDLSQKTGKALDFVMTGEDTEVDKSMVDGIGDPLLHMIRNAVDHGLEDSAEDRVRAGKPERGRVELRAFHQQGCLVIEVSDDGKGLDRDRILNKAREKGLEHAGDHMTDEEVWALIFEPGFSTAAVVTDVSGRGVGMDVVRKNVEAMRGRIVIHSTPGAGTTFSIRLPLTLAIIDGMVVSVGRERYIVPTLSITKSIQIERGQLLAVMERTEMLSLQGELVPLIRLNDLFDIPDAVTDPTRGIIVVAEFNQKKVGLLVDRLLGQQQIVIKALGELTRQSQGFSGGAIMPDGSIGLILDVAGLAALNQSAHHHTHERTSAMSAPVESVGSTRGVLVA